VFRAGPESDRSGMTTTGSGWVRSVRAALRTQEQLWDRLLHQPQLSGAEARALLGEPPLRWSGQRLRGSALPSSGEWR
jgi:hypothetical protein